MEEGKILIVDDEEDIREILEFNLENAGYSVDCAASAEEALEILSPEHRLILLDVMMEGMSGFKMAEVVRKERGSQVPIIFLTAKNAENDLLTGFSAGGDDYISKPFSIHEVIARVKAVFDGVVKQIVVMPGYNQCVLVQHGNWFSFYCKLQNTVVKAGDKVRTGQVIGIVDTINGDTQLHFQIWQKQTPQNPELWLRKNK